MECFKILFSEATASKMEKRVAIVPESMTLNLPDRLYQRLVNTARATQRSLAVW